MTTEYNRKFQKLQAFLARKPVLITLFILWPIFMFYGFTVVNGLVRTAHMKRVITRMADLAEYSKENFKGMEASEIYLQNLKSIDTGHAPADFKQALQAYIASYEASLTALKAGIDGRPMEAQMSQAKQRMTAIYNRYQ